MIKVNFFKYYFKHLLYLEQAEKDKKQIQDLEEQISNLTYMVESQSQAMRDQAKRTEKMLDDSQKASQKFDQKLLDEIEKLRQKESNLEKQLQNEREFNKKSQAKGNI